MSEYNNYLTIPPERKCEYFSKMPTSNKVELIGQHKQVRDLEDQEAILLNSEIPVTVVEQFTITFNIKHNCPQFNQVVWDDEANKPKWLHENVLPPELEPYRI